jgi:hypothetical protein
MNSGALRKISKRIIIIIFLFCVSYIQAQNFEKQLKKGNYHSMQRMLESNLANNPDDVKSLYYYSRYYNDTLNPKFNLYSAYQKGLDAYSIFDNKLDKRHQDRLVKNGITKELLKQNILEICGRALDEVNKNPSLFKYEDYLSKYKNGDNNVERAIRSRDSFELTNAVKDNTEDAYRIFIEKYPNSIFLNQAIHSRDKIGYDKALSLRTVEALDEYMSRYPASEYHYPAKLKRDSTAFAFASNQNTEEAFDQFISRYPDAKQVSIARTKQENVVSLIALSATDMKPIEYYLQKYPAGKHVKEVENRKASLIFNEIKGQNTIAAYFGFINRYPQSEWAKIAWDSVASITKRTQGIDGIQRLIATETNPDRKLKLWTILYETYIGNDGRPAIESFEKKYPDNPLTDRIAKDKEIYK